MHEAGIAERMLEVVLGRAAAAGAGRVTVVELEAGDDCGASEEAIRFHWAEAARGTRAEQAELRILASDDTTALRVAAIEVVDA
jgi:Zn finger protein HypA/HybF involved in hydrogenase expression